MANPTIVSLAFLKVSWDVHRRDYLENFVPLVVECLKSLDDDIVSLSELQGHMSKTFGIRLPQGSLDRILKRAKQRGYVTLKNHSYVRDLDKLRTLNFSKVRSEVLLMHERLVAKLVQFCKSKYGIKWSIEQAESALQAFLSENKLRLTKLQNGGLVPKPKGTPESAIFLVSSFIQGLIDSGDSDSGYVETLAKGHMLANAIFLPEQAQAKKKFLGTRLFFDTSFLIFVLGYGGEIRQASRMELVQLLLDSGADLRCFSHTVDEIHGIFWAISQKIAEGQRHDLYGPSADYFLDKGYSASDIMLLGAQLARDLGRIGIKVSERPDYIKEHVIDEKALSDTLQVYYKNPQALQRDVDSVSSILRLREGRETPILEECRAIFVTTNSFLSNTVNDFFYLEAAAGAISPCLTDYALMNLLWLKQPLRAPDLPWKRVVADCYAATQPDDHLWQLYISEIEKLERKGSVSTDDYYMLRYSIEAKAALMDLTLGREEAFREGTVKDILSRVREKVQEDVKRQLKDAAGKVEQSESRVNEFKEEAAAAKRELEKKEALERARRERIRVRAGKGAAGLFWVIRPLAVLAFVVGGLYTFPFDLPPLSAALGKYAVSLISLLMAAMSFAGLLFGTSLSSFLKRQETNVGRAIERLLLALSES